MHVPVFWSLGSPPGKNQNEQALSHYEMAMRDHVPGTRGEHEALCRAGIARCSIRMGDLARGMQIALELNDPAVCRECAQALAKMKQYVEAAEPPGLKSSG